MFAIEFKLLLFHIMKLHPHVAVSVNKLKSYENE